jgi:long-chain acyl-CoA synthetase
MLSLKTVNDIFFRFTASDRASAVLSMDANGAWHPISTGQIYQRVCTLSQALLDWGIEKGDRIAILAENRWEWAVADFAILAIGAVDVPIYPTLTGEQVARLLADSGSRIVFVSTRLQYEKVAAIRHLTQLEHIVVMDEVADPPAILFSTLMGGADARAGQRDVEFDRRAYDVQPEDLATLIYTSGTTGEPKGVMLTHGNIASNVNYSTADFRFQPTDTCISFLPLSHITARHLDYALFSQQVMLAYCPVFDKLPAAMTSVCPTIFVAVPRVYEKIRQEVERRASLSPTKKRMLAGALAIGAKRREIVLHGTQPKAVLWKLANKLVYQKVRGAFGGRVRYFISGGAPLGLDTANWFADVGLLILEGYGLTETSPVIAINTPVSHRVGSVGKPLPNVECRLAADGELLVRGPAVFRGYWRQPEATREALDEGGWFRTGDIARIDDVGFLYVTDRKKELLKTSGGKLIAPQPLENKLKANLLVAQAALVGDRHKFVSALISPNFVALEEWAIAHNIAAATRSDLVVDPVVQAEYQRIVDQVNSSLANFETIKRFRLVPDEWLLDSGELTPSMKLKRRVIYQKYAREIDEFYLDEAVSKA